MEEVKGLERQIEQTAYISQEYLKDYDNPTRILK